MKNTKVAIFLASGFEIAEALIVVDILKRAKIKVDMVNINNEEIISSNQNINVKTNVKINDLRWDNYKLLILPGGQPGTTNLLASKKLCEKLKEFASQKEKIIAAICAAPLILAKLGILKNKRAVVYPGFEKYLKANKVKNEKEKNLVIDDNIITAKALGNAFTFAFILVDLFLKEKTTSKVIKEQLFF